VTGCSALLPSAGFFNTARLLLGRWLSERSRLVFTGTSRPPSRHTSGEGFLRQFGNRNFDRDDLSDLESIRSTRSWYSGGVVESTCGEAHCAIANLLGQEARDDKS